MTFHTMIRKYKHRQTGEIIEAVTFDELVEHGRQQTSRPGIPWSFDIWDQHVSHENDDCYFVGDRERFRRGEVLGHRGGDVCTWTEEEFRGCFDPVTEEPQDPCANWTAKDWVREGYRLFGERQANGLGSFEQTPPLQHTELDIIDATEKSAQMMLGMAARARGAVRLGEENARLRREVSRWQERANGIGLENIRLRAEIDRRDALAGAAMVSGADRIALTAELAEARAENGRQAARITLDAVRLDIARATLDALSRLGNGGYVGNSDGNRIATKALAAMDSVGLDTPAPGCQSPVAGNTVS